METHELSWFERTQKSLKLDSLVKKFDLSRARLIEIAVFMAVGFLIGILWKKYSDYIIATLIFIGVLIILQHFEMINIFINWSVIGEICGVDPSQDIGTACLGWGRTHLLSLVGFALGISIGLKVS